MRPSQVIYPPERFSPSIVTSVPSHTNSPAPDPGCLFSLLHLLYRTFHHGDWRKKAVGRLSTNLAYTSLAASSWRKKVPYMCVGVAKRDPTNEQHRTKYLAGRGGKRLHKTCPSAPQRGLADLDRDSLLVCPPPHGETLQKAMGDAAYGCFTEFISSSYLCSVGFGVLGPPSRDSPGRPRPRIIQTQTDRPRIMVDMASIHTAWGIFCLR